MTTNTNTFAPLALDNAARVRIATKWLSQYDAAAVDALADYLACGDVIDDDDVNLLVAAGLGHVSVRGRFSLTMAGLNAGTALGDIDLDA